MNGFSGGSAGEGQDLQGPLRDGGRVGRALLIPTDVVDVVPKKTAITLPRHTRNKDQDETA